MRLITASAAAIAATLSVAGCAQQEEPEEVVIETPIYAKDGTIIGTRPMVTPGGYDDSMGTMDEEGPTDN